MWLCLLKIRCQKLAKVKHCMAVQYAYCNAPQQKLSNCSICKHITWSSERSVPLITR